MTNERKFLITYGLHNYVFHTNTNGKQTFTIRSMENQKMISHAKSLISGMYGMSTQIQVV